VKRGSSFENYKAKNPFHLAKLFGVVTGDHMGKLFTPQVAKRRIFIPAFLSGIGAPWMKVAAWWGLGRIGHISLKYNSLASCFHIRVRNGHGRLQRLGIRVQGLFKYLIPLAKLGR
jgi:hypothetical protein